MSYPWLRPRRAISSQRLACGPRLLSRTAARDGFGPIECETPRKARLTLDHTLGCGQVAKPRQTFGSVVSGKPPSGGQPYGLWHALVRCDGVVAPRMTPEHPPKNSMANRCGHTL